MKSSVVYCCPMAGCAHSPLRASSDGLHCRHGHVFPYAQGTEIPIFARESEGASEYTQTDAATIHDNALRWLFKTFRVDEAAFRRDLVARLGLGRGDTVLVTGVGAGDDLPYIIERLEGSGAIHAIDIAQQMLLAGVRRHAPAAAGDGIDMSFAIGDAQSLPFPDFCFDAAYHFGGINLFPDVRKGIEEMNRVVRPGGRVVIGDEGLAPWLLDTDIGRMLICNNALYGRQPPLSMLPATAREVRVSWELSNTFYVVEFTVSDEPPPIDIDVPHVGGRGGTIRTRYFGQLEGVDPRLKERLYAHARARGISRVELIESLLKQGLPET